MGERFLFGRMPMNVIDAIKQHRSIRAYKPDPMMIEELGVENLAQVYTAVKYTRKSHQEFSTTVLNCLKPQDFMN
jgi:nitroreductase